MELKQYKNEWEIPSFDFGVAGLSIAGEVRHIAKEKVPEYLEFFPFNSGYESKSYTDGHFVCVQLTNTTGQMPEVGSIEDKELIRIAKEIFEQQNYPSYEFCLFKLRQKGYTHDVFTYIGKVEGKKLSWPHIYNVLIGWLNTNVLPRITELNEKRINVRFPCFRPSRYREIALT